MMERWFPFVKNRPLPDFLQTRRKCSKIFQRILFFLWESFRDVHWKKSEKWLVYADLFYAGNHGFEIMFKKHVWTHPELKGFTSSLKKIVRALHSRTRGINGIIIEDKKLTASIHYRNVTDQSPGSILAVITEILAPYPDAFTVARGKKVFEIRPLVEWDKGKGGRAFN